MFVESESMKTQKNHQRRSIVHEQSALLETIKACAKLEKMREKMVKEGQEVSYHNMRQS